MYTRQPVDMQPALICVFSVRRLPRCLCSPFRVCLCLLQVLAPLNTHKNALKVL